MMYKKAVVEIVKFDDFDEFMTGSLSDGYCDDYEDSAHHHCIGYQQGVSCDEWTTPSFGGGKCYNYTVGGKCYNYYDNTHNPCTEYGVTCTIF